VREISAVRGHHQGMAASIEAQARLVGEAFAAAFYQRFNADRMTVAAFYVRTHTPRRRARVCQGERV
jgi:hypothetical protein